ncbi:MAG: hypothetical protein MUF54_18135 [Polyangiaceae bacterium]|jgi:hypothetical protein|nr:hypothetical protein [Polyangiaceae bacterium]
MTRHVERGCLALATVAVFALVWRNMDLLGDSFWSAATGRFILEHGRLPTEDPFSFTANRPWIVHMPASQIAFGWVATRLGLLALELFGALVSWGALLLVWLPHARSPAARALAWPLLILAVLVQADDLCVRGQVFGDLCLAVLLLLLLRLRDGRRVSPILGLVLGALWINLHSSVFLAVGVPLMWATTLLLVPRSARPPLRPFAALAGAAAVGALINPYHVRLVADLAQLLLSASTRSIDLFRSPDFGSVPVLAAFAVMAVVAVGCLVRRDPSCGVPEACLLVFWMAVGVTGRRFVALGLMTAIALAGRLATAWLQSDRPIARWQRPASLAMGAAAAAIAFWGLSVDKDPWRDVPLEEARMVEELNLPDRVANTYHWGGYLDYAWYGRRKVFVDGRNQLFEGGAFQDAQALEGLRDWQGVLGRYQVNTVLWKRGSALDAALAASGAWVEVHRGRIAVLYVRRGSGRAGPP